MSDDSYCRFCGQRQCEPWCIKKRRVASTREPGEARAEDRNRVYPATVTVGEPERYPVDAATIRRQAIDECIAARPVFRGKDGFVINSRYNDALMDYVRALEALRETTGEPANVKIQAGETGAGHPRRAARPGEGD